MEVIEPNADGTLPEPPRNETPEGIALDEIYRHSDSLVSSIRSLHHGFMNAFLPMSDDPESLDIVASLASRILSREEARAARQPDRESDEEEDEHEWTESDDADVTISVFNSTFPEGPDARRAKAEIIALRRAHATNHGGRGKVARGNSVKDLQEALLSKLGLDAAAEDVKRSARRRKAASKKPDAPSKGGAQHPTRRSRKSPRR